MVEDEIVSIDDQGKEGIRIDRISVGKFVFLSIITMGLYEVWWIYKSWRFFKYKDNLDIAPAIRAMTSFIFLIPLFNKILKLASANGYKQKYSSIFLFFGYFVVCLLVKLPKPAMLVAILAFVFLIPPFKALNYAFDYCDGYVVFEQKGFNGREVFLIVVGSIFWFLLLVGVAM